MAVLDEIFAAGIVGAGGAGFPTHKKLVPEAKLLIINAVECEPLLASDRYVMRHFAPELVSAITQIVRELRIARVVIGTKTKYVEEIASLQAAIAAAGADIEIFGLESFYPAGDEQVLIYEITGQTVPPGGIPIALGIVVINVTTTLNIARAMGGSPVTRRFVTVNGAVAHPTIVDAPIGTSPADLIAAAGGATISSYGLVRGGPMMGRQYAGGEAGQIGYGKADGGLLVLPTDSPVFVRHAATTSRVVLEAKSACIQCQLCTQLCPRYLIGHQMRPHRVMRAIDTANPDDLADALLCCECGVCEIYACPMGLHPRQINIFAKSILREHGVKIADVGVHDEHTTQRGYRRIAQSRFIERLQLGGYPTHLYDLVACQPEVVRIPVKHGVGKPSTPVVKAGERVKVGQVIAEVGRDDVGCLVHASIDGQVAEVTDQYVVIRG